jgi:hypothetical protein
MEPAAETDGRTGAILSRPSVVFLCGDEEHLAGTIKADVIFDGCDKVNNFSSIVFPDSPVPANGFENRSVEIDDLDHDFVRLEESGILADSVKRIDIGEEGLVGVKADSTGKIFMLPFMDCRTRDDLFFFFREKSVLRFEDEQCSVGSLLAFASSVYERRDCLHAA